MKSIGLLMIVVGLAMTIFTTFKYFSRDKIVDIGKLEITANVPHYYSWSPLIGVLVMGIGAVIVWQSSKKSI